MRGTAALACAAFLATGCTAPSGSTDRSAWTTRGAVLQGDVDGDGRVDRVAIEERMPRACRVRLAVWTRAGRVRAPINPSLCDPGSGLPVLQALAAVDRGAGLEVVVELNRGASTEFSGLWTMRKRVLHQLRLPDCCEGSFPYHGSVGHDDRVDCVRPGVVVVSGSQLVGLAGRRERLLVGRSFYRISGLRLIRISRERRVIVSRSGIRLPEWKEPQPFPSCTKARAGGR